jgi:cobalt-zinc-cadmium efflux system membrane fusion protein
MQAPEEIESPLGTKEPPKKVRGWFITAMIIGITGILCIVLWFGLSKRAPNEPAKEEKEASGNTVDINSAAAGVQVVTVGSQAPESVFTVAGTVEPNQQQLQQVTLLVAGRVEHIYVALGDNVKAGSLLLRIDSPQVAEQHGKLHEAETRLRLAKINLDRVQQAANRVSVLKAKASLDEAESTLKRTKLLVSEGLTARKDLVAAQSESDRAKADYNFQKDISLNREVSEAKAELQTAQTETEHIRDSLKALDAHLSESEGVEHNISKIELRSPISGTVIERFVNTGAGFEQGKPLLTIANTAILWVIANVPETQMATIHIGSPATVKLGSKEVAGKVSYVDPRLNEDTRTSRVRIEIANPNNKIQVGTFAQIKFEIPVAAQAIAYVPDAAVQTVEGKPIVFVKESSGKFAVRQVKVGTASSGMVPVVSGVRVGEQVAVNGSFVLKSKLLREQFGDED